MPDWASLIVGIVGQIPQCKEENRGVGGGGVLGGRAVLELTDT